MAHYCIISALQAGDAEYYEKNPKLRPTIKKKNPESQRAWAHPDSGFRLRTRVVLRSTARACDRGEARQASRDGAVPPEGHTFALTLEEKQVVCVLRD